MVTEARLIEAAVAPRVTLAQLEATIVGEHYFTAHDGMSGAIEASTYQGRTRPTEDNDDLAPLKLLTFCVLVLKNGFSVTGESACADPKNFNAEIGRELARKQAVGKLWPLLGYELKSKLVLLNEASEKSVPEMQTYVGTKVIHAQPMSRREYNTFRGWDLPKDENGSDEGFLVEYTDGGQPNVVGYKGYLSWSPKEVFEKAYKVIGS